MRFVGALDAILALTIAWQLLDDFVDTALHSQTRCWLKGDNISDLEFVGWHIQYRNLTPWISRGYRHHRAAFHWVRWEKPPSVLIGHTRDGSLRFDGESVRNHFLRRLTPIPNSEFFAIEVENHRCIEAGPFTGGDCVGGLPIQSQPRCDLFLFERRFQPG